MQGTLAPLASLNNRFVLDANSMTHEGWLTPDQKYIWGWGSPIRACVHIQTLESCLQLSFVTSDGLHRQECIAIEYGPCHFGVRPLFVCAGCDKSFYKLYFRDSCFRCRSCHHLKWPRSEGSSSEERTEQRREMVGRALIAPPDDVPLNAPLWANKPASIIPLEVRELCGVLSMDTLRIRPDAQENLQMRTVHPASIPGWGGGRPRLSLSEVSCTCGAGSSLEGHRTTCPRGRLIYQRRRRNTPLD